MFEFRNWNLTADPFLGRQFDNLTQRLEVTGDLPEGWTWEMLIQVEDAMDMIPLESSETGVGTDLTADQLALSGYYSMQLRGKRGMQVRHTNVVTVFVSSSLSENKRWPTLPSEFIKLEQRLLSINAHPPVAGENGYWMLWNPDVEEYETSQFLTPDGGYYLPQLEENGLLSFTASKLGMPDGPNANIRGPKGEKGDKGDSGAQGIQGEVGPQGVQGEQGAQGVAGQDGKSAYQQAVEAGYSGSEELFAQSLSQFPDHMSDIENPHKVTAKQIEAASEIHANQHSLGGADPIVPSDIGAATRPNLLDNWYFADPINQQGMLEYSGIGYTIDRLKCTGGAAPLVLSNDGITFKGGVGNAWWRYIQDVDESSHLLGKTVTFSVLLADGTLGTGTGTVPATIPDEITRIAVSYSCTGFSIDLYIMSDGLLMYQVSTSPAAPDVTVKAIKLELGETQSLAQTDATDGSWVMIDVPPNKSLELAKCQRYYYKTTNILHGIAVETNQLRTTIKCPQVLRAAPNVKFGDISWLYHYGYSTEYCSDATISLMGFYGDVLDIVITFIGDVATQHEIVPVFISELEIDANL